jgi:hypothetical protein
MIQEEIKAVILTGPGRLYYVTAYRLEIQTWTPGGGRTFLFVTVCTRFGAYPAPYQICTGIYISLQD